MRLTKRELGRRTVSELSESSGCRSEWWDSASGSVRSLHVVDENVIHIDNKPSFHYEVIKDVVHQCLKGSGGVA